MHKYIHTLITHIYIYRIERAKQKNLAYHENVDTYNSFIITCFPQDGKRSYKPIYFYCQSFNNWISTFDEL